MDQLFKFHQNKAQREIVKAFLIQNLKELAVARTFNGEPVTGIKDAKEAIDKSFDKLEEIYGKIKEKKIPNSR